MNQCQVTLLYIIFLQVVLVVLSWDMKAHMFVRLQFVTVMAYMPYTCRCSSWLVWKHFGKTLLLQKPGNFRTWNFFTCWTKLWGIILKPAAAVQNMGYHHHFRSESLHVMRIILYSVIIGSHWRLVALCIIASSLGPLEAWDWCRLICTVSITNWLHNIWCWGQWTQCLWISPADHKLYRCHSIYNLMICLPTWNLISVTDLISSNDMS